MKPYLFLLYRRHSTEKHGPLPVFSDRAHYQNFRSAT